MAWAIAIAAAAALLLVATVPAPTDWSPLAPLSGDGAVGSPGGTHPVAAHGDTVHVVWAEHGDLRYRRSRDAGSTWESSTQLTRGGTALYPCSLELSGSVLHLLWPDRRNGTWEMYYNQSADDGDTWPRETRLTPGVHLFRMGTAIAGAVIHVAWGSTSLVSPTPAGTHTWGGIYYKRSTDGGATWEPTVRLTLPEASAMRPGIAAHSSYVHLTWFDRREAKGLLDWRIYHKRSTDGGATWGPDVPMPSAPERFPHHPQIAATQGGKVCCVWEEGQVFDGARWFGDPALYASVSQDDGETWARPKRITFVNAPHGWATHAKSCACGSRIHLAWTDAPDGTDKPRAAFYMTSADGGLTWSDPERLTSASDGECGVESVGGTGSYVIVVVRRAETLWYRRRGL
jgi:hypothetical protein